MISPVGDDGPPADFGAPDRLRGGLLSTIVGMNPPMRRRRRPRCARTIPYLAAAWHSGYVILSVMASCAAASRATGTRNGEQDT